jgi:CDP-4-dehydro-6-deoxyglucose reductase, E3
MLSANDQAPDIAGCATGQLMSKNFQIALVGSEKSFSVQPGETVLAASRRAKLALPYSCLSGRCGTCAALVVSGQWRYQHEPSALSATERSNHALLCQAQPCSDMQLKIKEVDDVADLPIVRTFATLVEKTLIRSDVLIAKLASEQSFRYLAGQYLEFVLPDGKKRPFSIANAPSADGLLELHVRKVAGGGFTQSLFDDAKLGDRFELDVPHGTFVPRNHSDRPMLFVAGGTGFAPIKALLEHFYQHQCRRPMHLYWGAREANDFYLLAEQSCAAGKIAKLKRSFFEDVIQHWQSLGLQFTRVLSDQASADTRYGSLHGAVLEDYPDLSAYDLYMSGPPAMISAARAGFLAAQLPEDRLYYDSFDFAPDVLAALIQARQVRG